jgi:hypothetical protein
MQDQLIIFGWVMVAVFSLTILVPWLLRWSDLLTTWNLFIFGAINFVGYAAVQSGQGVYSYCLPTNEEYRKLMFGTLAFFIPLYFVYYKVKWPGRAAGRTLLAWPPYSGMALGVLVLLCTVLVLLSMFYPNVQFIGQILIIIGPSAGVIAVALTFVRWWNNKLNAALLVMCAGLLILSLLAAVHGQTGRRFLLSALVVIPMCLYWLHLRYKPMVYTVVPLIVGVISVTIILAAYSTIRHRYNAEIVNVTGRTAFQTAVESLRLLPRAIIELRGVRDIIGGDSMEASLVAINRYTKTAPPEPFFVIKYVVANPIPRAFWENKPEALGQTLPRDTGVWQRTGYVNWGPGIPGHGFHEGGYHMLVFYGILYALAMRYFDELLVRQSDNPYLLGMFAGASGQIIAFSRGDIGLFTVLVLGAILAGLVVRWLGRLFLGYKVFYPSDAERAAIAQGARVPSLPRDAELHIPQPYLAQYAEN